MSRLKALRRIRPQPSQAPPRIATGQGQPKARHLRSQPRRFGEWLAVPTALTECPPSLRRTSSSAECSLVGDEGSPARRHRRFEPAGRVEVDESLQVIGLWAGCAKNCRSTDTGLKRTVEGLRIACLRQGLVH